MSNLFKVLVGALGGALLVLILVAVFSGGGMMRGMGLMMSGGMLVSGMLGALFMLLSWGLVIALLVALIVWIVSQGQRR